MSSRNGAHRDAQRKSQLQTQSQWVLAKSHSSIQRLGYIGTSEWSAKAKAWERQWSPLRCHLNISKTRKCGENPEFKQAAKHSEKDISSNLSGTFLVHMNQMGQSSNSTTSTQGASDSVDLEFL